MAIDLWTSRAPGCFEPCCPVPLHRLFAFPERVDELMRHLEMVEEDERRQIDMIEASAQRLRESGYPVEDLTNQSMLDALQTLESWQAFHANKEHVRLGAVQLIGPFDEGLATEFERRCHAMQRLDEREDLEALEREINELAQTLEQRRASCPRPCRRGGTSASCSRTRVNFVPAI